MALRLAGEPFLAIQGADNQGWVREVTAQDALPGLKIDQQGTGRVFDFQDGGVSKLYLPDGGNVTVAGSLVFDLANDVTITPANPAAPRTLTIPDPGASDAFAFLAATQTLTNKTLSGPTIQGTVGAGTGLTMPAFVAGGAISSASGNVDIAPASGLAVAVASGQGVTVSGSGGFSHHRISITPTGLNDEASKVVIGSLTNDLVALLLVSNDTDKTSAIFTLTGGTAAKLVGDASWVDTDTDTKECVIVVGTDVVIKNRLGTLKYFSAAVFISG